MQNRYLELLELQPGASKQEIKAAYRRLSKLYHPDINKDEQAREKFIGIQEAYQFLTQVGPAPNNEPISYNYDPSTDEYAHRRQQAREYAQKKASEAAQVQNELIGKLLRGFNWVLIAIIIFNTLLTIDYLLPVREVTMPILGISKTIEMSRTGPYYRYDEIFFEDFTMQVNPGKIKEKENYEPAIVRVTPIFKKPLWATLYIEGATIKLEQIYNVYKVFGYIIPGIFILFFLYLFLIKTLDHKLTMALIILFMFVVQAFLFFLY